MAQRIELLDFFQICDVATRQGYIVELLCWDLVVGFPLFEIGPLVQILGLHFLLGLLILDLEYSFDVVSALHLIVQNRLKYAILAVLNILGLDLSFAFHFILYNIFGIFLRTFLTLRSSFVNIDLLVTINERHDILLGQLVRGWASMTEQL